MMAYSIFETLHAIHTIFCMHVDYMITWGKQKFTVVSKDCLYVYWVGKHILHRLLQVYKRRVGLVINLFSPFVMALCSIYEILVP